MSDKWVAGRFGKRSVTSLVCVCPLVRRKSLSTWPSIKSGRKSASEFGRISGSTRKVRNSVRGGESTKKPGEPGSRPNTKRSNRTRGRFVIGTSAGNSKAGPLSKSKRLFVFKTAVAGSANAPWIVARNAGLQACALITITRPESVEGCSATDATSLKAFSRTLNFRRLSGSVGSTLT